MSELWSEKEINYCVRVYLWMREFEQAVERVRNNVAALSPNCHREAHYWNRKKEIRKFLLEKIAKIENA